MPNNSNSRRLDIDEVKRLVAASEIKKKEMEQSKAAAKSWPGAYNLHLLAEAVSTRRMFVTFENGVRFKIRYVAKYESVFIKPADNGYVPCGWFTYKRLKEALETNEHAA